MSARLDRALHRQVCPVVPLWAINHEPRAAAQVSCKTVKDTKVLRRPPAHSQLEVEEKRRRKLTPNRCRGYNPPRSLVASPLCVEGQVVGVAVMLE